MYFKRPKKRNLNHIVSPPPLNFTLTYILTFKIIVLKKNYPHRCVLLTHTDHIQQQHEFPHKPALDIFMSRCQLMSTPLYVLLKSDPSLEGNVAYYKADPSACPQLGQVLQYF